MAELGMQRQRHGVTKNLAEGVGGLIVGAALVLLIADLFKTSQGSKLPLGAASTDAYRGEKEQQR